MILIAAALALATDAQQCRGDTAQNKQVVLAFYQRALVDKQVRSAFETYAAPDFVEHKPDVAGGTREATIQFLEGLVQQVPQGKWQVVRSLAEGELVAVHVRFQPAPGAPDYAIADFFRLKNCLIVEHWDAVAPPSDAKGNPNPRF